MNNKTCGDCKHFDRVLGICDLTDDFSTVMSNTLACPDIEICPKPTNGDKIRQGGNKALASFRMQVACYSCAYAGRRGKCERPVGGTCAEGIELYLNAPAESDKNNG